MKLKKMIRIYTGPVILLILLLELVLISFLWYLSIEPGAIELLIIQSIITLIATFTGIFVPLLINRNWSNEDHRRELIFALSLVWHEINYNKFIRDNIESNLVFGNFAGFSGNQLIAAIKVISSKSNSMEKWSSGISLNSFYSIQNSGAINNFVFDDLINSVIEAYESLKDVHFAVLTFQSNMKKNVDLLNSGFTTLLLSSADESLIKADIQDQINKLRSKVLDASPKVNAGLSVLDSHLNLLGITRSES